MVSLKSEFKRFNAIQYFKMYSLKFDMMGKTIAKEADAAVEVDLLYHGLSYIVYLG